MKKKLIMLSLALISCVCVMSGAAACSYDDEGNVTDVHIHDVPLTYVEAVDATCTTAGNIAYYTCESCGKYFADYDATTELSASDVVVAASGHDYTTTFSWAEDYSKATATRVCSHDSTHTETVTAVITSDTTAATCTEAGSITYTATATFSDTKTATDTKTETLPATDHTYSTEWTTNSSSHWRVCTVCGARTDVAEHTFTATDSKASCSVCGTVANESLTLDTDKTLTLINSGTDDNGNYVTYSYLAYYASEAGEYSLELVAGNNSPILSMIDVVVSVNGTVVTGSDLVYTVELAAGTNNIEIALTGTSTVNPASENYTYTATLSAYVPLPTLSMGANTVSEEVTYEFTATDAGYYIFTVSGTKGWAYLYSADNLYNALYEEYYSDVDYYYTYLKANEVFALYVENGGDGDFVITITYSSENPDSNAVTTSVPATLELGSNSIALSSSDGSTGVSSIFTATEAGTYTFAIYGSYDAYATLGKVYGYDRSVLVYSGASKTYTLEADESLTIYFYADDDCEYTFYISSDDGSSSGGEVESNYLTSGTYTLETTNYSTYYGYLNSFEVKETGTYTFTYDTTNTTGSGDWAEIYFCESSGGTLHEALASITSSSTTATLELTAGDTIWIKIYDYTTSYEAAPVYIFTVSVETSGSDEPECNHEYEAAWNWTEDFSSATLTLTCSLCNDIQTPEVSVTNVTTAATTKEEGSIVYTATATLNGTTYTDTKTVTLPIVDHTYVATWTWAEDYSTASAYLLCSDCGDEKTLEATITSTTGSLGETIYTATVTVDETDYTDTKTIYPAGIFVGTIYNTADAGATSFSAGADFYEGITIAGTSTVSVTTLSYSSDESVVSYTDINGTTVNLTKALSIGYSKAKGITFTLKSEATIVLYYAVGSTNSFYLYVDEENTEQVVVLTPTTNNTVLMSEFTLTAGTYTIHCSKAGITGYIYAIGISEGALYIASQDDSQISLENGYTYIETSGDWSYIESEYELKATTSTYNLTVVDSGVYTFTAESSAITVDGTVISAGSSATFDLFADDVIDIIVTSDATLTVKYVEITGNASGAYDTTSGSYSFTAYSDSITLAAGEVAYYRIDAATQDADGNTSFNFYIYVSGDVDNISVYYSRLKDSEANIAEKDSYNLVELESGYYYITVTAKNHGFFKIVANSAATITVELKEGGDGNDINPYTAIELGETTVNMLLENGTYMAYYTYNASTAGSYTLTLSGTHSWWSNSTMLSMMVESITVTVNGTVISSTDGTYTLSLIAGENKIVINYALGSNMVTGYTYTVTLASGSTETETTYQALSIGDNDVVEDTTYQFTATTAGTYTFTVSGSNVNGYAYIASEDSYTATTYLDQADIEDGETVPTSFTLTLDADETITLYVYNGSDGDFTLTISL